MNVFYDTLESNWKDQNSSLYYRALKGMLSRSSVFAPFKRSFVRSHRELYPELAAFLEIA